MHCPQGGCASDGFQDVYVNVANYQSWIQSYINGADCQPSDGNTSTESGSTNTDDSNNGGGGGDESDPVGNQGNNQDEQKDNGKDNGNDGDEEGDDEENNEDEGDDKENDKDEGGDEEGDDDETALDLSTVDLDVFLDCFTTVVDLIQNVLGGGADNAGGKSGQGLGLDSGATEESTNAPARGFFASRFNRDADRDISILNNFEVDGEPMDEVLGLNDGSEGGDR